MQAKIFETLKTVMRARKITYADLANRLGLSEPTVKRVFAARDDKLSRIVRICEVLDVSLEDIVAQADRTEVAPIALGDRLEARLAADPSVFHLFILLRDGMPEAEIARHFRLDSADMFRMGSALERMGLAEILEGGRIRLTEDRPIRFRHDGPLHALLTRINMEFVRTAYLAPTTESQGFLTQSRRVSDHTARHVMRTLMQLSREVSEIARQDQLTLPEAQLSSYKISLVWSPVAFSRLLPITPGAQTHR